MGLPLLRPPPPSKASFGPFAPCCNNTGRVFCPPSSLRRSFLCRFNGTVGRRKSRCEDGVQLHPMSGEMHHTPTDFHISVTEHIYMLLYIVR